MHKNPESTNFDDLLNAVTRSTSCIAEMSLEDVVVLALTYIKDVSGWMFGVQKTRQAWARVGVVVSVVLIAWLKRCVVCAVM